MKKENFENNPFEDEEIQESQFNEQPNFEELAQGNPLYLDLDALDFDSDELKAACLVVSLLYHDFNAKKRLARLRAIILNLVEVYPSDRAKVKAVFKSKSKPKNPKPPTIRHGAKKAKNSTIKSSTNNDCVDCPKVQEVGQGSSFKKMKLGEGENLTFGRPKADENQATAAFSTIEDVFERFTEKGADEPNVIAMKVYCNNEGIALHPKASKPSTIGQAIIEHYQNLAAQSDEEE